MTMSNEDERVLNETLRIQAVGAGPGTLTLDDVRGRARRIRRTRAAAGATGVAALVAAAVVPLALLVGDGSSTDSLPPVSTPTVSDTANPEPAPRVDQTGSWRAGGEIHPAQGEPFPTVDGEISTFTWLDDGRWAMTVYPDSGQAVVVVTDEAGEVLATYDGGDSGLASDDAGGAVAWFGPDERPHVLVSGTDEPVVVPAPSRGGRAAPALVEVLPGCTTAECALVVEVYDDSEDGSTDYVVGLDGSLSPLDRLGLVSITDVSADGALVSGLSRADEDAFEFCSAVVVFATGEQLWETCDRSSFRFSPDGASVLAIDPYPDGFGHSFVDVLDALDGEVLRHYEGATVFDETWESPSTYLVSIQTNAGENLLLRLGLDGSEPEVVERGTGRPGEGSDLHLMRG